MPREVVVIQIGQCGNQIGAQFWETVLEEHAAAVAKQAGVAQNCSQRGDTTTWAPRFDASMSTFFRNVDARHHDCQNLEGDQPLKTLKARALLIDMEEGVLNDLRRGALGSLFDERLLISDVSGAGNNWAHGYCVYGPAHRERIADGLRRSLELTESPQGFILLHSLGGGTGSGLGSFVVQMLEEELPDLPRFCCSVVPSPIHVDDVVTAPYNNLLSLLHLHRHASCVLPVSNDALSTMCARMHESETKAARISGRCSSSVSASFSRLSRPFRSPRSVVESEERRSREGERAARRRTRRCAFAEMNGIVARVLSHLTSSLRFDGRLNVDLEDIATNLVPFPGLHFLLASLPSGNLPREDPTALSRAFSQSFNDLLAPAHQLFACQPTRSLCLAAAFLVRGANIPVSGLLQNVTRLRRSLKMLSCNEDATKIGLCEVAAVGQPYGLLGLSNSCEAAYLFSTIHSRFSKLFERKAHLHHYEQYMDTDTFIEASECVLDLARDYAYLDRHNFPPSSYLSSCSPPVHAAYASLVGVSASPHPALSASLC